MEEFAKTFGLDVKLVIVQIINFVVLLVLLSYFLYKPLLRVLAEREEKIKQGVEDAEAAGKRLAEADEEKKGIVSAAHKEAEEVAARAKAHAGEKEAAIIYDAEEKAAVIVRQAEEKGEQLKAQAHKDSEAEIAKLAVLAAEKVLREKTS